MPRRQDRRPARSTDRDRCNGDEEEDLRWTVKAGPTRGFDFTQDCAVFADEEYIPRMFLASEAERDLTVHGRIIPMNTPDFAAVRQSFYRRLEEFYTRKQPGLQFQNGPKGASILNSGDGKLMDKHVELRSPSPMLGKDCELFSK